MNGFRQELRLAVRKLLARPGFSLFIVLTLAVGIGAATVVLSLANALFLHPVPFKDADRLVVVHTAAQRGEPGDREPVSYPDFQELARSEALVDTALFSDLWNLTLSGGDRPERVLVRFVSGRFFPLLGVGPRLGRGFLPEDDRAAGGPAIALISHALWKLRFASDPSLVGRTVLLDDRPFEVVGVMPEDLRDLAAGEATDVWLPVTVSSQVFTPAYLEKRDHRWLTALARLAPGTSLEQAGRQMAALSLRMTETWPETNEGLRMQLSPLAEYAFGYRDLNRTTLILTAGAAFVLLIGCVNVANLLLVRSLARSRETAILISLGASRERLVGRLLLESSLLALTGGILGALLSVWGTRVLLVLSPLPLPPFVEVRVDGWVLAAALVVSLVTGLLVGLFPAVRGLRAGVRHALQQSSRNSSASWGAARRLLITAEIASALVLLVGGGLLIRSFLELRGTGYGFRSDGLVIASLRMSSVKYPEPAALRAFYAPVLERVAAIPGVQSAHLWGPGRAGSSEFYREVFLEGRSREGDAERCRLFEHRVTAGTLQSLEIPVRRGRAIEPVDRADSPAAAVVSESAAKACWPGEDPLGKRFRRNETPEAPWFTVVGVAGDARHRGRDARAYTPRDVYYSLPQVPTSLVTLLVQTDQASGAISGPLRQAVLSLDPDLPLFDLTSMEQVMREEESESRFYALLMGTYAAVSLLLATSGLYSMLAYAVVQRTREIGIRMALGAQPGNVLRLVAGEVLALVAAGVAVGLVGAWLLTRTLSGLLYGVDATDMVTFLGTPLLLGGVAGLAAYFPTRKATRIDPLVAFRQE